MHPEDLDRLNEKEAISLDFKLNVISVEDITHHKTVYPIRLMHTDGNYRTILHQSRAINVSHEDRVQQTICIYTDITHLNVPMDHTMSFISDTCLSYFSIKTKGLNKFVECKSENIFTNREIEIIQNLAVGKNSKKIAAALSLSPHTVNTHKKNILRKAECKTTPKLIAKCIREGTI